MSFFATFAFPPTALPVGRYLDDRAVTAELERVVPTGSSTHYLWLVGDDHEGVVGSLRDDPSVESMAVVDDLVDRVLVRVQWHRLDGPLVDLVDEHGVIPVDATGTEDGWTVTLRFTDEGSLARFYEACRQRGLALELREIGGGGFHESDDSYGLSSVQLETVQAALGAGYFDVPRRITIVELAERLGVSEQAISERLRRGLGQFLDVVLDQEKPTGSRDGGDRDG